MITANTNTTAHYTSWEITEGGMNMRKQEAMEAWHEAQADSDSDTLPHLDEDERELSSDAKVEA